MASAEGADDVFADSDCTALQTAVERGTSALAAQLAAQMLAVKRNLAQRAQGRMAHAQRQAAADMAQMHSVLDAEVSAREQVEAKLERARKVQQNLGDALRQAKQDGDARLAAAAVIAEWHRGLLALKRDEYLSRAAPAHYAKTLLRKLIGRWRSASRAHRHRRIDAFWENSMEELKEAMAEHYDPRIAQLTAELEAAKADAAEAWRERDELGVQLKAAFMRGVCQLNLETASIVNRTAAAPRPTEAAGADAENAPPQVRPEEILASAQRGLRAASARMPKPTPRKP